MNGIQNIPNIPSNVVNSMGGDSQLGVGILGVGAIFFAVIFFWLLGIIINWKIIDKIEGKGWKALIPFYSDYTIWKNVWAGKYYLISLILGLVATSFAGDILINTSNNNVLFSGSLALLAALFLAIITILGIIYLFKLSAAFGHTGLFVIGLYLLPVIFEMILAFSDNEYVGKTSNKKKK